MTGAVVAALPDFRGTCEAKARVLGHDGAAARGGICSRRSASAGTIAWPDATERVREAFAGYSPDLVGLANRAFAENWIDAETREGKQGGATARASPTT
jgi:oligoendopeptidase F